jgi:hypothetical protein
MSRAVLGRASSVAQLVAAGTLALVGVRFGGEGILYAVHSRAPVLDSAKPAPPAPPAPPASTPAPAPTPRGPTAKHGAALRLSLVVSTGAQRSAVIVDGVTVGHAPYIGEVTCKAGEKVKIDLLPPKGTPKRFERLCAPGGLRIGD